MSKLCKNCGHEKKDHGWDNGIEHSRSCRVSWYEGTTKPRKICYCPCKKFEDVHPSIKCNCSDCKEVTYIQGL